MELKGTIEEMSTKAGKNGNYYKLKIKGQTFNVFSPTEAHEQIEMKEIKLGDTVIVDYTASPGEYQGQPVTYKNANKFTKTAAEVQTHTEAPAKTGPDWDMKDRRITRLAAINSSIEFFKMNQTALPDQAKAISEQSVFKMAEMIENWAYRPVAKKLDEIQGSDEE